MLLAFGMGSQMAVLTVEQPGSDGFVDGNSDSDETPELPPDPDIIRHCELALCWSWMPRGPLLRRRGCSLLPDPSQKAFAFLSVVTQGL